MDLQDTNELADNLMREYGLIDAGWRFEFDRSKCRFGICKYRNRVIGMSRELVLLNDFANVNDTLRHEIAHALVGPGHRHNMTWKMKAMAIGAKPVACYSASELNTPEPKYELVCGVCTKVLKGYHRKPRRSFANSYHRPCGKSARLTIREYSSSDISIDSFIKLFA